MESGHADKSGRAAVFLSSLPVVKLGDMNAEQHCDICMEGFTSEEDAVQLPCGHIFGRTCIAKWLSPDEGSPNKTCPMCRAELFPKAQIWSPPPPPPLLTTSPNPTSPPELSHPELLARMAELHTIDYAGIFDDEPGPAAEAFKLQHLITQELAQDAAAADRPRAIPTSVLDDAVASLARQIGRLYDYHHLRWRSRYSPTSPAWWDERGPSVEDLRDPDQERDFAHHLYDVVCIERRVRRLRAGDLHFA